jgi:molybdopterin molybdotransferase
VIAPSRALRLLLARARPLPSERVPLIEAVGRWTAETFRAPLDLPRVEMSSMDGYGVPSAATRRAARGKPLRLAVARRTIFAGSPPGPAIAPRTAVRIMTGAPLPAGVDAVLPLEEARREGAGLVLTRPVRRGRHVRRAGEDCRRGDRLVPRGSRLQPGTIALLASLGFKTALVHRSPRVAVVVTGSEVRRPTARRLPPHAVRDSHAAFLSAALQEFDIEPVRATYADDDFADIRKKVAAATARADLIVVTGGVSVGDRDLVRPVLSSLGVRTVFWRVAQTPGKPLYVGHLRGSLVLGLPGNPASVAVCYCEYVRPAIRAMCGERNAAPEEWEARLVRPIRVDRERTKLLRGRLTRRGARWRVAADRRQSSHLLRSFVASDCVIVAPPGKGGSLRAGARVRVHPLPWRRP